MLLFGSGYKGRYPKHLYMWVSFNVLRLKKEVFGRGGFGSYGSEAGGCYSLGG